MRWLVDDLAQHTGTPKIVVIHMRLVTGFLQYGDLVGQIPDDGLVVANARTVAQNPFTERCEAGSSGAHAHMRDGSVRPMPIHHNGRRLWGLVAWTTSSLLQWLWVD
jgi:hypothetical protein